MPTENERKYVLDCRDPDADLSELKGRNPYSTIQQGYLVRDKDTTCRVRISLTHDGWFDHKMAVKVRVPSRGTVEVETSLESRDFWDLWGVSKAQLRKVRVYVEGWEIDFFLRPDKSVYFVLAEHEMPEGQEAPESMTAFVRDRLLYEVPRWDDRFSNRKLGKVKYAEVLLSSLRKEAEES